jgi:hypothetical protein
MKCRELQEGRAMATKEKLKKRRLDRMRLGQAVCDWVVLPSDPETRMAVVPLSEADYISVLNKVATMEFRDDMAGLAMRERVQSQEILIHAIREPDDFSRKVYATVEELIDEENGGLTQIDVDEAIEVYNEMIHVGSPAIDGIPPGEFVELKKVLQEMDWNALSGRQWYAAKRFLSAISPRPLLDNSLGYGSTQKLTTTND